jgi:hypothetical protein
LPGLEPDNGFPEYIEQICMAAKVPGLPRRGIVPAQTISASQASSLGAAM